MTANDHQSNLLTNRCRERLAEGRRAMGHLIHVWHERNGWSHKVLPALAESLDLGKVHNSQISNLRNGKLASPGPEVFLALSQINTILDQGIEHIKDHLAKDHPELLNVLLESAFPVLNNEGTPVSAGEFFEIFIGLRPLPECFDWFIEDDEAIHISEALADCFCGGKSWRQSREEVMSAYRILKPSRRDRFAEVMSGLRDYTAEELDGELLDLYQTYINLGGDMKNGINTFLSNLRAKI